MDSFFKDKVYIVTGGGAGIGLAIARQLAEQGAYSYALDIHKEPTDEFSATTHELLIYDCCDVRDRQRCHEVTSSIIEKHGRLDGLVNNAAVTLIEGELPDDEIFQTTYDINVKGVWNMGTEALVQMRGQANGAIVNIASTSARNGVPRLPVYSSTKHAVLGLTRTWALDFAKYQVRVNCIAPGPTDTAMGRSPLQTVMGPRFGGNKTDDELLECVAQSVPLKRIAQPDDIAYAVLFLLNGKYASYITGEILCVAGGT